MASIYSAWNFTVESISQISNHIRYANLPEVARSDNRHCLFLAKLNPDIRVMIYKSVLSPLGWGCGAIHLKVEETSRTGPSFTPSKEVRLRSKRCTRWEANHECTYLEECNNIRIKQLYPDFNWMEEYQRMLKRKEKRKKIHWWAKVGIKLKPDEPPKTWPIYAYLVLGLLLSCRDVYHEAWPVFYQNNVFTFVQPKTLFTLQQTLPNHSLRSIRFVHFSTTLDARWNSTKRTAIASDAQCDPHFKQFTIDILTQWGSAWTVIANEMKGLQNLEVSFTSLPIPGARTVLDEETLLHVFRPMMDVHVPKFEVCFGNFGWGNGMNNSRDVGWGPLPDCLGRVVRVLELEAGRNAPFHVKNYPFTRLIRLVVSDETCMDWVTGKLPYG